MISHRVHRAHGGRKRRVWGLGWIALMVLSWAAALAAMPGCVQPKSAVVEPGAVQAPVEVATQVTATMPVDFEAMITATVCSAVQAALVQSQDQSQRSAPVEQRGALNVTRTDQSTGDKWTTRLLVVALTMALLCPSALGFLKRKALPGR